jgi:hypothetical protein
MNKILCHEIFETDDCTECCDERAIIVAKDKGNKREPVKYQVKQMTENI